MFCGIEISEEEHKNRKYCNNLCKRRMYRMRHDMPATAHGEHYTFWKVLHSYTLTELQVLLRKRKIDCKHAASEEIQKLRKEMKIITRVYTKLRLLQEK
jgi:hypothetical protein